VLAVLSWLLLTDWTLPGLLLALCGAPPSLGVPLAGLVSLGVLLGVGGASGSSLGLSLPSGLAACRDSHRSADALSGVAAES
jgi:hypothetical protein